MDELQKLRRENEYLYVLFGRDKEIKTIKTTSLKSYNILKQTHERAGKKVDASLDLKLMIQAQENYIDRFCDLEVADKPFLGFTSSEGTFDFSNANLFAVVDGKRQKPYDLISKGYNFQDFPNIPKNIRAQLRSDYLKNVGIRSQILGN